MRLRALVDFGEEISAADAYNRLTTCKVCGARSLGNDSTRSTVPSGWNFTGQNERTKLWTVTTGDMSCREAVYSRMVDLGWYVNAVHELELLDAPYPDGHANPATLAMYGHVQDLVNAIWLGLTRYESRFRYDPGHVHIIMPPEMINRDTNSTGPIYSIVGWFLKQGTSSIMQPVNEYGTQRRNSLTVAEVKKGMGAIHELLDQPLTRTVRNDLLREAIRYLWVTLEGSTSGFSDLHTWSKQMIVYHAMGGLDGICPDQGFTYYVYREAVVPAVTSASPSKPIRKPKYLCNHAYPSRDTGFNGSLTFYSRFFTRVLDGRAVTRFLNGGTGVMKSTAKKYLRYVLWPIDE